MSNTKLLLYLILASVLAYLVLSLLNRCKRDNFVGMSRSKSFREQCEDEHPEAARMDMDADNSIADTVIEQCMKECEAQQGGCPSCM